MMPPRGRRAELSSPSGRSGRADPLPSSPPSLLFAYKSLSLGALKRDARRGEESERLATPLVTFCWISHKAAPFPHFSHLSLCTIQSPELRYSPDVADGRAYGHNGERAREGSEGGGSLTIAGRPHVVAVRFGTTPLSTIERASTSKPYPKLPAVARTFFCGGARKPCRTDEGVNT